MRDTATGVDRTRLLLRNGGVAEQDLIGFPGLERQWSPHGLSGRLTVAFDEHVNAPL